MHQIQWAIHSNQTERSPRHLSLKRLTARASPYYGGAMLSHHGPPEPLLSESQGLLLALMAGITMYPIKRQMALTHGNDEGHHSLCLTFWGCVYVHETLIEDETVVNTEHLALFCLSFCSKALLEEGISPRWQCALPEMEPLVAPG